MPKIDFAFDLGTECIRLYKEGKIVKQIPSFDETIKTFLVKEGKICVFYDLEQKLLALIKKHIKRKLGIFIPKMSGLMIIPGEENGVTMRAGYDLMEFIGITPGYLIFDYVVALAGLGIDKKGTYMLVDSGAGKTRMTTINEGNIMEPYSTSVTEMAGNSLNETISLGLSREFNLQITPKQAEALKKEFGSLETELPTRYVTVKGTDKITGTPGEVTITNEQLNAWLKKEAEFIKSRICQHYELLPPEIQQQIQQTGVYLVGKNFRFPGLIESIAQEIPVSTLSYQLSRDYMQEGMSYIQQNPDEYLPYMIH